MFLKENVNYANILLEFISTAGKKMALGSHPFREVIWFGHFPDFQIKATADNHLDLDREVWQDHLTLC